MRLLTVVVLLFVILPSYANPDAAKVWACTERYSGGSQILIWAEIIAGDTGRVRANGIEQYALHEVTGLDHRWRFGPDKKFQVIIFPDLTGGYYDFSAAKPDEIIQPRVELECYVEAVPTK